MSDHRGGFEAARANADRDVVRGKWAVSGDNRCDKRQLGIEHTQRSDGKTTRTDLDTLHRRGKARRHEASSVLVTCSPLSTKTQDRFVAQIM